MDPTERDQIRAALHGDRDVFEMIIRNQSRTLFAVAYGVLQNREEAEDAVQDAFIKAWKSRWLVRDPEKFPAWLATIARNRARDVVRRRRTVPLPENFDDIADTEAPAAGEQMDGAQLNRQVHSALSALPETHRTALTLRYLQDMDYQTIERTMGLTNGALRGILGRALGSMRKELRPALATLPFP